MKAGLQKLKKLKGRSLTELRKRTAQALAARSERYGLLPSARLPSDRELRTLLSPAEADGSNHLLAEKLLDKLRARRRSHFFTAFANPEQTSALLHERFEKDYLEKTIQSARSITENRFDLLGLRDIYFGNPIDWHFEPQAKKRTPLKHWSLIDYLNPEVAGDKKITWELNRHQHFITLGRAYWHTRDELYARTFCAHVAAWMEANQPKLGINWASSLEVAFRSIAWLWALHFFMDSPHMEPTIFLRMLKFLYVHATHLETYLSTFFSPNTHLTGEALGLYYLGTVLQPTFRRTEQWRAIGRRILLSELERQIRPDGVYFEQASYYHRYTTDFYTHFWVLANLNGEALPLSLEEKLESLLEHLMAITRPDGTTPFFGDDDGGRLLPLDQRPANDFRAALSTGAVLFDCPDFKYVAGTAAEETLWLLGPEGLSRFDDIAAQSPTGDSRAFDESGFYVMRDGWSEDANYLLIDCGPHGGLNAGHSHADALSFELAARGRTLLVDPGTYTYTGSAAMRDWFRSTAAHNALTIDGESSSTPSGPFRWAKVAQAQPTAWESHARFDFLAGRHDGFRQTKANADCSRRVLFLKGDYWIINDRITPSDDDLHQLGLHFHFAVGTNPQIDSSGSGAPAISERGAQQKGLDLSVFGVAGEWRREEGWFSPVYGALSTAPVLTFSASVRGPQSLYTFLLPCHVGRSRVTVSEAASGRVFRIFREQEPGIVDHLLISENSLAHTDGVTSDFALAWMRFRSGEAVPSELVLIDGRQFSIFEQEIIKGRDQRVRWVAAHREDDHLIIETSAYAEVQRLRIKSAMMV